MKSTEQSVIEELEAGAVLCWMLREYNEAKNKNKPYTHKVAGDKTCNV